MSKYTIYYSSRQDMYRKLASRWLQWAKGVELTEAEQDGISKFFNHIAKRFGLITEFKQMGLL